MATEKTLTISISGVPKTLVKQVDEIARAEHRDRSGQIVKILEVIVRERLAAKRTPQAIPQHN